MAKTPAKIFKRFDLDDPKLPVAIEKAALASGGYPYDKRIKREDLREDLGRLQIELLKLQNHIQAKGKRIVGLTKGATEQAKRVHHQVHRAHEYAQCALGRPDQADRNRTRPVVFSALRAHLPTAGESCSSTAPGTTAPASNASWASAASEVAFLREAPDFEELLVRDGIRLFKFYLTIGREMQFERFHERARSR